MAFKDPARATSVPASPKLVGEIIDVQIVPNDPMLSTITVRANPADNLNIYSGDYTLRMDGSKSVASRLEVWQKARAEGTGFCGALITEDTKRKLGEKVLFEGVRFQDERNATTSWLRSYKNERRRSPGLLKTIEATATDPYTNQPYKSLKLVSVACQEGDAFDLREDARWAKLMKRADHYYKLGTTPSNLRNEKGQLFLRASMPATSATFALIDNETKQVVEFSALNSKILPNPADYPEHYTDRDITLAGGRRAYIPRNGENFEKMRHGYFAHIKEHYPGRDMTPICIELTEYRVTTKASKNADLQCPITPAIGSNPNPLQEMHHANSVYFRDDASEASSFTRPGSYHPDICLQKAPNVGQTFSQFVRPEYDYQPAEYRNLPWLAFVNFKGSPLQLNPKLLIPHDSQYQPLSVASPVADHVVNPAQAETKAAQNHHEKTTTKPVMKEPLPHDPAFSEEKGFVSEEAEAAQLEDRMKKHEQEAAGVKQKSQSSSDVDSVSQTRNDSTPPRGAPPLPDTSDFSATIEAHRFTENDCPFSGR